ncbi:MAG: hypothetical protein ACLFSE_09395 [Spirochaetia bacterium]
MRYNFKILGFILAAFVLALAGCEVIFIGPSDSTAPVINSVSHSPTTAYTNEEVTFSVAYNEPDSPDTVDVSWDTDMDGNYDDTNSIVYTTSGAKTVSVKVTSRGGTAIQDYAFTIFKAPSTGEAILTIENSSGQELTLYIDNAEKGEIGDGDVYEYVLDVGNHEVYGENALFTWGPETVDLDSDGHTFEFLPPSGRSGSRQAVTGYSVHGEVR